MLPRRKGSLRKKEWTALLFIITCSILSLIKLSEPLARIRISIQERTRIIEEKNHYDTTELVNLIEFDNTDHHNISSSCARDVTPAILDEWRDAKQEVCSFGTFTKEAYPLKRWEYSPTFMVYENITLDDLSQDISSLNCSLWNKKLMTPDHGTMDGDSKSGATFLSQITQPIIRLGPNRDPDNSYERFHAYLNVAMVMAILNITNPQLIIIYQKASIPMGDKEMWESFSNLQPIYLTKMNGTVVMEEESNHHDSSLSPIRSVGSKRLSRMVDLMPTFSPWTSLLVTKSGGALKGRGTVHHCKSNLFQGITKWMKSNLLRGSDDFGTYNDESNIIGSGKDNKTIQVVWSSRAPYCCRPPGVMYTPKRSIDKEDEFLKQLDKKLGDRYNLTRVDFGSETTIDSVKIASRSQIFVGVHGAGLMWSAFLPKHSGLVEIFGGDRNSVNRHYHNIASLADIHYRFLSLRGNALSLKWDERSVDQIVKKIESIRFDEEPGEQD